MWRSKAAAAGRYVVASRLDGIPEAIVPGQNGTLLDPLDSDAFVYHYPGPARKTTSAGRSLGSKAREFVRNRYSWDIIARRYLRVFMKVIQDPLSVQGDRD